VRQEAARKTVPREELEEKALVSLAKVFSFCMAFCFCFYSNEETKHLSHWL